jgi:hypothetical protein
MSAFMNIIRRTRLGAALAILLGALSLIAPAAASASAVPTFPAAGATFVCQDGSYFTVTGGLVRAPFHDSFSANGSETVTGTIVPENNVTLEYSADPGTVYTISGAGWFGGHVGSNITVFTNTDNFVIHGPSGAPVADVHAVAHVTVNSQGTPTSFSLDMGTCDAPSDG